MRLHHRVVQFLQRLADEVANVGVIFDDQDGFLAVGGGRRGALNLTLADPLLVVARARQVDPDRGALAGLAVDFDVAARLLDETINLAQAEAGALAGLFGREERLEGARGDSSDLDAPRRVVARPAAHQTGRSSALSAQ